MPGSCPSTFFMSSALAFQRIDVDAVGAAFGGRTLLFQALDQGEDAAIGALGRDDDQRVRAIVGQDLRQRVITAPICDGGSVLPSAAGTLMGALGAGLRRLADVEDLLQHLRDFGRDDVLEAQHPDLSRRSSRHRAPAPPLPCA